MQPITTNPNRIDLDEAYLQMAAIWAMRSKANRLQVGALLVKDTQIVSDGYNGMPANDPDDVCEIWDPETGELRTKSEVLHAESNALMKLARFGSRAAEGATLYTTHSPCFECAKLIKQAGVKRVIFRNQYRDMAGVTFLLKRGIAVEQRSNEAPAPVIQPVIQPSPAPNRVTNPAFSQLRQVANMVPPPAPEPVPVPVPVPAQPAFPAEDEVAKLLAAAERMMQGERAAEAKAKAQASGFGDLPLSDDAPYRSSFL